MTRLPERGLRPYESLVKSAGSGLSKPSRLVTNQIRTISRKRVGEIIGQISVEEVRELDRALKIQLSLEN